MAALAAAPTCGGVGKSGSPAPKSSTSTPCAFNRIASAATFIVGDTPIRPALAASMNSGPHRMLRRAFVAQPRLDDVRHQAVYGAAERHDFLDQARAHV